VEEKDDGIKSIATLGIGCRASLDVELSWSVRTRVRIPAFSVLGARREFEHAFFGPR